MGLYAINWYKWAIFAVIVDFKEPKARCHIPTLSGKEKVNTLIGKIKKLSKDPVFFLGILSAVLLGAAAFSPLAKINSSSAKAQSVPALTDNFVSSAKDGNPTASLALSFTQDNTLQAASPPQAVNLAVLASISDETSSQPNGNSITYYTVQSGDSLWGIAQEFGISINTIVWANNIDGEMIQPGQQLTILPVSGVMHKVVSGDTVGALAQKYGAKASDILTVNNLTNDGDIYVGEMLIIPGGTLPSASSISLPAEGNETKYSTNNFYGKSHAYPFGQCTWWVAQNRAIPSWGNAIDWLPNAKAQGYKTCTGSYCTPEVGAVAELRGDPVYGHVGYVVNVQGNRVEVSEMNYIGFGKVDYRWITIGSPSLKGYIY